MDSFLKNYYSLGSNREKILSFPEDGKKSSFFHFDGFHTRGKAAVKELCDKADIFKHAKILDLGCGTGGSSRYFSEKYNAISVGIDYSFDYLEIADYFSRSFFDHEKPFFINGDAVSLPFKSSVFDFVFTEHVQVNIKNKEKFYNEISRVLKTGGKLVFHDVFSCGKDVLYPLPFAEDKKFAYLIDEEKCKELMHCSGLDSIDFTNMDKKSLEFFSKITGENLSPNKDKGLWLVMGENYPEKILNMKKNLSEKRISLIQGCAVKKAENFPAQVLVNRG